MNVWKKKSQDPHHRRLSSIGETRWCAKDAALKKVFRFFGNPQNALFVYVVLTLTNIEEMASQKPNVCVKARGFKEALLKYETILTAQTFLCVFEQTSPLSKYLQTSGLDILTAHRMVVETQEALQKNARNFDSVKRAADIFVQWANAKLQEQDEDTKLEVQTELAKKRIRKRKTMPGELAQDEVERDMEMAYKTKYELTCLAGQWEKLKKSAVEEYTTKIVREIPVDGTDEEQLDQRYVIITENNM
ncbi:zinc finger MYM-type 1 [Labeo rohita]|uniref:Zinc finger MYM-type 1 n=1 Tax=Labeo rohita TaxID=84645 RepID=A0A498NHI5_LABRO|nr:zinc finger MYM-type 1 [Labeo rohita]RXN31305.1 zinc finger MYM-type 1 [Labeo rohita]